MKSDISCILFDLDDTLTDRPASIRIFAERFQADFRESLHSSVPFDTIHEVIQIGDGGGYRPKDNLFSEIQRDLRWVHLPDFEAIQTYWYTVSPACMRLRVGVHATLSELRRRGYKLGIITNGKTDVQNATIDAVDVRQYMQTVLVSETVGLRKPDPRIFHRAVADLDAVSENALYVGDNPEADVLGARNAGLQAAWLSNQRNWPTEFAQPHYQISEIADIIGLLTEKTLEG